MLYQKYLLDVSSGRLITSQRSGMPSAAVVISGAICKKSYSLQPHTDPTDNTMLNVPVPVPGSLQHNIGQTSPHLTRQEGCLLSRHSPRSGQVISFGPESPSGHLFLSRVTFTVPRP
ncbi:hypothetical protein Pcinc_024288 [Petrolisthes cinctipes]|uniref:Uncharacterized protein n=1 Tax=Petrolisthes cinctipes TaxID=88211 RepID=A0AAE1FCD7_PETCI|nr:hypothetical protein Pcinc_024288 [Petrolisthes cinctipes]